MVSEVLIFLHIRYGTHIVFVILEQIGVFLQGFGVKSMRYLVTILWYE